MCQSQPESLNLTNHIYMKHVVADDGEYEYNFANRLRLTRVESGISQRQLADMLDVTFGAVAHWESGRREPNLSTLRGICRALKVSADYLLGSTFCDCCGKPYEVQTHKRFCSDNCRKKNHRLNGRKER